MPGNCALAGVCACRCGACSKKGNHLHSSHDGGCHWNCTKPPKGTRRGGARGGGQGPGTRGGCGCKCNSCTNGKHDRCTSDPKCKFSADPDKAIASGKKCKCSCTMCRKAMPGCTTGKCLGH